MISIFSLTENEEKSLEQNYNHVVGIHLPAMPMNLPNYFHTPDATFCCMSSILVCITTIIISAIIFHCASVGANKLSFAATTLSISLWFFFFFVSLSAPLSLSMWFILAAMSDGMVTILNLIVLPFAMMMAVASVYGHQNGLCHGHLWLLCIINCATRIINCAFCYITYNLISAKVKIVEAHVHIDQNLITFISHVSKAIQLINDMQILYRIMDQLVIEWLLCRIFFYNFSRALLLS